jgi:cysteinyl-tRNA synthetase
MPASLPELRLYNTLTHRKDAFVPINSANVRLYACGPTVYDHLHIGNGRMLIVFDVLFRLLRYRYGAEHVTFVRNITDVDDKINARAAERGIDIRQLTDEMTAIFHEDAAALGCLPPTIEPRATEHMAAMAQIIERLVANGHAYVEQDHVLFAVGSMADYGALSRRSLDEMIAGARVDVAPYKRNAMDFVLWKPSKPGEPGWPSPAGIGVPGRPGWHIECSAMAWQHLGETFDIHGGGIDLVFPHHENELAQTRCAFGRDRMANVWMHNGHLQVEGEKMSKSLGNFITIRELWASEKFGGRKWPTEVLRLAMLRTHYRQPMDWTVRALEEAEKTLTRWVAHVRDGGRDGVSPSGTDDSEACLAAFIEALSDDLNVPLALGILHQIEDPGEFGQAVQLLGLDLNAFEEWTRSLASSVDTSYVQGLIDARNLARKARNFKESDRLRDELAAMNIALKDNKDGTTSWEVKR